MDNLPGTKTIFKGDRTGLKSVIPIAHRLEPDFYDAETEKIFRRSWLVVACTTDLPEKGSYVVVDVPPLKASLLVVRGQDDQVRVFHNVCRHRGDKLVQTPSGCRRAFTCGFHAWTYSNTGNLIGITDASQFPGIEKEQFGLLTVRSEVWESLVYVNFDPEAESLRDWMGETYDQYSGFAKDRVKVSDHRIVMRTNWNLAVSAFCEGYHNLYIHRNTVPDYQGGTTNPNRHRAYLEVGRRFGRYSAFGNPDHKPTPAEGLLYRHSRPLFPSFPPVDPASLPAGVNPSRFPRWAFDLAPMFPNFVLITQANMHGFMWFWPIDHNHTDIRVMRFAFASNKPADLIAQAHSRVRVREILREDLATMETNYEGLVSAALPHIVLSQQEMLIQNHFRAADDMLRKD